jgi:hypothetical protein
MELTHFTQTFDKMNMEKSTQQESDMMIAGLKQLAVFVLVQKLSFVLERCTTEFRVSVSHVIFKSCHLFVAHTRYGKFKSAANESYPNQ